MKECARLIQITYKMEFICVSKLYIAVLKLQNSEHKYCDTDIL